MAAGRDAVSGAAALLEAWARTGIGDTAGARAACDEALRLLEDPWALSHAEAMLGGLAQAEQRYADAVAHLSRAAEAAQRLGFVAAGALRLANLGRAQQQNGIPAAALDTLAQAAAAAASVGDLRGVAYARTRRALVLYELGRLDECRAGLPTANGDLLTAHLTALLAGARAAGDHDVELLTARALTPDLTGSTGDVSP